jgi:hypothetical protein
MGYGTLGSFWDMTNAFPSSQFSLLDHVVQKQQADPCRAWSLIVRHRRSLLTIRDASGEAVVLRLLRGDRQGDVPSAQQIILAFDPSMESFDKEVQSIMEERLLVFRHPVYNTEHNASMIRSADDIARLGVLLTPACVQAKEDDWNAVLNRKLLECGIVQNPGKRQRLVEWRGKKSRE